MADLQQYTYAYLMKTALAYVPDTLDKRQGSIIYDALAPACYALANFYLELQNMALETNILTADGEWLDKLAEQLGISRQPASAAVKKGVFVAKDNTPASVPIGSRWSSVSVSGVPLIYDVTAQYTQDGSPVAGTYEMTCETPGVAGHEYTGALVPIDYLTPLQSATLGDTITPGEDTETDEQLRQRCMDRINWHAFGGNIAEYREWALAIAGVGAVQVWPTWNGAGTVKLSIIDSTYEPVTQDFLDQVQEDVDPINAATWGEGFGIAPIGHKVTVVTATSLSIDVSATVTVLSGYTLSQIEPGIKTAIDDYLETLRESWGKSDTLNNYSVVVYVSAVIAAIMSVAGVANATNVTLNGNATDIQCTETAQTQQLPILGTVTINGA